MPKSGAGTADSTWVMTTSEPNEYLKTKVQTATPAELRLMLFDGAIKFLEQGKTGLVQKNYEASYTGITRCQEILVELMTTLEPKHAPELCEKLSSLYTFMYTRLVEACTERDVAKAEEVLDLLRYERETWDQLMAKLAEENTAGAEAADVVAAGAAQTTPPNRKPVGNLTGQLIGGQVSVRG